MIPFLHLGPLTIPTFGLMVATGLLAAAYLLQADILPALGETIWDTSQILPDDGIIGKLMHTLVGYTARPYGIQLGFYAATLAVLLVLMKLFAHGGEPARRPAVQSDGEFSRSAVRR